MNNIQLDLVMLAIGPHYMASALIFYVAVAESHAEISLASCVQHWTVHNLP